MTYQADPGEIFASDTHRRTLAHLDVPGGRTYTAEELLERMHPDVGTDYADEDEVAEVLEDLEADGYAEDKNGWKQTKKGHDALNAGVPEEEVTDG